MFAFGFAALVAFVGRIDFGAFDAFALASLGCRCLGLGLLGCLSRLTFLALPAFLFLRLLRRTGGGVDGIQIDLAYHLRSVGHLGFAQREDLGFGWFLRRLLCLRLPGCLRFCLCGFAGGFLACRLFSGCLAGGFCGCLGCCLGLGLCGLTRRFLACRLLCGCLTGGFGSCFLRFLRLRCCCALRRLTVRLDLDGHVFVEFLR